MSTGMLVKNIDEEPLRTLFSVDVKDVVNKTDLVFPERGEKLVFSLSINPDSELFGLVMIDERIELRKCNQKNCEYCMSVNILYLETEL